MKINIKKLYLKYLKKYKNTFKLLFEHIQMILLLK